MGKRDYFNFNRIAIAFIVSLVVVGCNIDNSYDLSDVADNTNIGIGSDDSCFDLPLMEANVALSQLTSGDYTSYGVSSVSRSDSSSSSSLDSVLSLVDELTTILPSNLEGEYADGIDLTKLDDEDYTSGLVEQLFDELSEDEEKRVAFAEFMISESSDDTISDYEAVVVQYEAVLGCSLDDFDSVQSCADATKTALDSEDAAQIAQINNLISEVTSVVVLKADDILTSFLVSEDIDEGIDVGEDVLEMIEKNLDGDKNTLSLLADIDTGDDLPLDVVITASIVLRDGSKIEIAEYVDKSEEVDAGAQISSEQFSSLISGMTFMVEVSINNYNPAVGDLTFDDKYVKIKIIARKRGSLTL